MAAQVDREQGALPHDKAAEAEWQRAASELSHAFRVKQGLDVGRCNLVLHVRPCEGLVRQIDGSIEKRFSKVQLLYPIQARAEMTSSLPD